MVELESADPGIDAQVDLPIDELGAALGIAVATDAFGLSQLRAVIVDYIETAAIEISSCSLWY